LSGDPKTVEIVGFPNLM
jgi:hypothetical protein